MKKIIFAILIITNVAQSAYVIGVPTKYTQGTNWVTPDSAYELDNYYASYESDSVGVQAADSAYGTNWSAPTNVFSSDDSYASYTTERSNKLIIIDWDFSIPSTATILGIAITIEGYGDEIPTVGLTKDGSTYAGTPVTIETFNEGEQTYVLGYIGDAWETTWTYSEINAGTFGVLVSTEAQGGRGCNVDYVGLTIYYSYLPDELVFYGFDFNLPKDAIIDSIYASVEGHSITESDPVVFNITEDSGVTVSATSKSWTLPASDDTVEEKSGGLWGESWDAEKINDIRFGLVLSANNFWRNLYLDQVWITLIYHFPASYTDGFATDYQQLGAANIADAEIRSVSANTNYGVRTTFSVATLNTAYSNNTLIGFPGLAAAIGAGKEFIAPCTLQIYVSALGGSGAGDMYARTLLKPMFEGDKNAATADTFDCSWNDWFAADSEWNTAGALFLSNDSTYNALDDNGADAKSTPFDTVTISVASVRIKIAIPISIMQEFYSGNRGGILLTGKAVSNDTLNATFRSGEYGTSSYRPTLDVYYQSIATNDLRRRKLLLE